MSTSEFGRSFLLSADLYFTLFLQWGYMVQKINVVIGNKSLMTHAFTRRAYRAVLFFLTRFHWFTNRDQHHDNVPSLFTGFVDSLQSTAPSRFCVGKCSFRFWTAFVSFLLLPQPLFFLSSSRVSCVCYFFSSVRFCTRYEGASHW